MMATSSRSGFGSTGWNKWYLAFALGAPLAVGVGVWYYKQRRKLIAARSVEKLSIDESKENLLSTESQDPIAKAQAAKNKGNTHFKAGKYEEAIRCYTEAITLCPPEEKQDISTFYQNRAATYEQMQNYEAVINDCTEALQLNSRYTKALNRRAKAYEHTSKLQQALEDITAVCIMEGFQNQSSLSMADRVLKQLGKDRAAVAIKNRKPVIPSGHFIRVYFSSFSEDPILKAAKDLSSPEGASVNGEASGYTRALKCVSSGQYESIIDDCSAELQGDSSNHRFEALLLRATFYLLSGQGHLAEKDLQEVISTDTADSKVRVNALIKQGSIHIQNDKTEDAMQSFDQAIQIDSNNTDIYHHRAQVNILLDKVQEAMNDFEKAVSLNPSFAVAHLQKCYTDYRYALITSDTSKVESCMEGFRKSILQFPKCSEGFTLYAQALSDQQKYQEADEQYKNALSVEPQNANIIVHRGLLQLQWKHDVNAAVSLMRQAIDTDDKCEFAYETLGTIEVQRANMEEAVRLFAKAIALAKTEAEMAHLYSLSDAAMAQTEVARRLGIQIPALGGM